MDPLPAGREAAVRGVTEAGLVSPLRALGRNARRDEANPRPRKAGQGSEPGWGGERKGAGTFGVMGEVCVFGAGETVYAFARTQRAQV